MKPSTQGYLACGVILVLNTVLVCIAVATSNVPMGLCGLIWQIAAVVGIAMIRAEERKR